MSDLTRRLRTLAVLTLMAAAAAGCSGAKSTDSSAGDATASATDAAAASDPVAIDVCAKVPLAAVQPFYGASLTAKKEDDLIGSAGGCIYHTADDHTNVRILAVTGMHAQDFYDGNATRNGAAGVPLPGVGDKAVRQAGDVTVVAMKGGVFCMVDSSIHARDSLKGAEKFPDSPIPDAIAAPLAQKLATLCTPLWN